MLKKKSQIFIQAIKYILEIKRGFFDTLYQISPESFFGEDYE